MIVKNMVIYEQWETVKMFLTRACLLFVNILSLSFVSQAHHFFLAINVSNFKEIKNFLFIYLFLLFSHKTWELQVGANTWPQILNLKFLYQWNFLYLFWGFLFLIYPYIELRYQKIPHISIFFFFNLPRFDSQIKILQPLSV